MPSTLRERTWALAIAAAASFGLSSPALATAEPSTRLVNCKAGSCLLVTGRRANAASTVSINGHAVAAEGARKWRARVPVDTLRAWSEPFARSITVTFADAETRTDATAEADLPIGLLGHVENLALLVVSVK